MRKLLNVVAREYLERRTKGALTEKEMNELGNTLCLTAYYGGVLEMKQLARYAGVNPQKFSKDIRKIVDKFYGKRLYTRAMDEQIWSERTPELESFLASMAAGLVEYGYWIDTADEPESRVVARKTVAQFAPATIVSSKSEFKGYLATIEYLWASIEDKGSVREARPTTWIKRRYGRQKANEDVSAFLARLSEHSDLKSRKALIELKVAALSNWQDCQDGRRPDWVATTHALIAKALGDEDDGEEARATPPIGCKFQAPPKNPPRNRWVFLVTLSSEVREGAVGFGHTMAIFLLLEGSASFVVGVDNLEL